MKRYLVLLLMTVVLTASWVLAEELVEKETFLYNDGGKRDPFWPLVSMSGSIISYNEEDLSASDMMLTGVMTGSDGKNIAVINGKIVKEGDMIGAFKIDKILSTSVVLYRGQEKSELYLRKEE